MTGRRLSSIVVVIPVSVDGEVCDRGTRFYVIYMLITVEPVWKF